MIELRFDFGAFERMASDLAANLDQVPYAVSQALNQSAFGARAVLVQHTWPSSVTVRNRSFISAALRVEKAGKHNLRVAITESGRMKDRAHLALHAFGGVKRSKGNLAIPSRAVRRGASGVVGSQLPRNLTRKVVRGDAIYQAVGKGKASKLKLMYTLKPTARQPADVPFSEDFAVAMRNGMRTSFPQALARAMRTRR
jgi:hypothetical protein